MEIWCTKIEAGWVIRAGDDVSEALTYGEARARLAELGISDTEARSGLLTAEDMPAPSGFQFA